MAKEGGLKQTKESGSADHCSESGQIMNQFLLTSSIAGADGHASEYPCRWDIAQLEKVPMTSANLNVGEFKPKRRGYPPKTGQLEPVRFWGLGIRSEV
jgi:hypothetical protein